MRDILRNTDMINSYLPSYENGYWASVASIKNLEESKVFNQYGEGLQRNNSVSHKYTLYADKYTYEFENYCLENGLGERCEEGIFLNEDVAYTYMSILA